MVLSQSFAGSKQKSYEAMRIPETMGQGKSNIGDMTTLNMADFTHTTVQAIKLPLVVQAD